MSQFGFEVSSQLEPLEKGAAALNLGPKHRAHGCVDQYHSEKGQFTVQLPVGKYRVVVVRGAGPAFCSGMDLKEMEAVRQVFGKNAPAISSTKSLTGHSLGAAGAQEAIYSLLMLNNGFLAESANIETLDPAFEDMPILLKRADRQVETVMSNSFGFGGTNATLVMSKYLG